MKSITDNKNHKIKLIHVMQNLEVGGMENGVVNLCNRINRARFVPEICCLRGFGHMDEYLKPDVKVTNMNFPEGRNLGLLLKMIKYFKKERPGIVHTHNFYSEVYGILSAKLAGVPVIIHGTHGMRQIDKKNKIYATKFLSLFTDEFLTVSETLKKELIRETGISQRKVKSILNGVDIDKFQKQIDINKKKETLGIKTNMKVVGTIGRLVPVKNYKFLITAFSLLKKTFSDVTLLFIGDGPLRKSLQSTVNSQNLEKNVIFAGERNDVAAMLRIMDVFVLPSLSEGMSNTILEAMASGLPVVASNIGNNSKLIKDGETGVLVSINEPNQLSNAISGILSNPIKSITMGEAGYAYAKNCFSIEQMVNNYEKVYEYWVKRKGELKH